MLFSIRLPGAPGWLESVVGLHQDVWRRISAEIKELSAIQNFTGDISQTLLLVRWESRGSKSLQHSGMYQIPRSSGEKCSREHVRHTTW